MLRRALDIEIEGQRKKEDMEEESNEGWFEQRRCN